MGHYSINLNEMNIQGIVGSAHKFHGPKGIGFLYLNNKHKISPFIHGGAQERKHEGWDRKCLRNLWGYLKP